MNRRVAKKIENRELAKIRVTLTELRQEILAAWMPFCKGDEDSIESVHRNVLRTMGSLMNDILRVPRTADPRARAAKQRRLIVQCRASALAPRVAIVRMRRVPAAATQLSTMLQDVKADAPAPAVPPPLPPQRRVLRSTAFSQAYA